LEEDRSGIEELLACGIAMGIRYPVGAFARRRIAPMSSHLPHDILPKSRQEAHKPLDGKAFELVMQQGGDFGLIDFERRRNFSLGKPAPLHDTVDRHFCRVQPNGITSSFQWYPDAMQIIVELPDDMARQMIPAGRDPARAALEDMAVEAYRAHRLTEHQLATLLGMDRYELDGFLKQREVWLEYTMDDLRREVELGERLWKKRQEELAASGQ